MIALVAWEELLIASIYAHLIHSQNSSFLLSQVFSESKIVEYSIQENATGPGDGEVEIISHHLIVLANGHGHLMMCFFPLLLQVLIDNKQYYKVLGRDINVISLIRLHLKDGKVVRHEDWYAMLPGFTI